MFSLYYCKLEQTGLVNWPWNSNIPSNSFAISRRYHSSTPILYYVIFTITNTLSDKNMESLFPQLISISRFILLNAPNITASNLCNCHMLYWKDLKKGAGYALNAQPDMLTIMLLSKIYIFPQFFFIWYVGKSSISSNNNNNNKIPLNYCFLINWFVIERFGATLRFELPQSYIFQPEFQMFLSPSDRCNLISILYQLCIDIAHIGMHD